jgi:hypothetical protein
MAIAVSVTKKIRLPLVPLGITESDDATDSDKTTITVAK